MRMSKKVTTTTTLIIIPWPLGVPTEVTIEGQKNALNNNIIKHNNNSDNPLTSRRTDDGGKNQRTGSGYEMYTTRPDLYELFDYLLPSLASLRPSFEDIAAPW